MAISKTGDGTMVVGAIEPNGVARTVVGASPLPIKGVTNGVISVTPGAIAANTGADITLTLTGVAVGDWVDFEIPTNLDAGLSYGGHIVSAASTIKLRVVNETVGLITGAAKNWAYHWMKLI